MNSIKVKNKKKIKKSKLKILTFSIIIIILIIATIKKYEHKKHIISNNFNNISLRIEGLSKNILYEGIGQEKVEGKDGYDTIFTTVDGKIYKEYKQTGQASWKNKSYWGGTFEENGCGLSAIATLASGYKLNYTPEDLRKRYIKFQGEHLEGDQMSDEIEKYLGISNTDFLYDDIYFKKDYVIEHLKKNKPILICVWNKPDNKWTTSSHYMLILATDCQNKIYISNPNGLYGKIKMSGWYNTEEILPYIAKAMFINK